LSE
jgi:hypothetical protein